MPMDYYVHIDLYDAIGPAIHKAQCRCVRYRRPDARTTKWEGPLPAPQARRTARAEAGPHPVRDAPHCCGGLRLT